AARHVLHHDVARVLAHAGVEDLADVRVRELAGERGLGEEELAEEAPAHRVAQRLRKDALHGHVARAERIVAEEDFGGRAFPELPDDGVVADLLQSAQALPRAGRRLTHLRWRGAADMVARG